MKNDISNQITDLQKNVFELNYLFEVSIIASQAYSLQDFTKKISDFILETLGISDIFFFIIEKGVFKSIYEDSQTSQSKSMFEFENNNEGLWKLFQEKSFIKVVDEKKQPLFKTFWENNHLENLNSRYFKVFSQVKKPFCICSLGDKNNGEDYSAKDIDTLERIFKYIEPILMKFYKQSEKESELKSLQKSLHNISILYSISQAVNFIDDLKRLLKIILDKALVTVEAQKGSLMLYDYSDNSLQVKVVYGLDDKALEFDINNGFVECSKIRAGEGIAGTVFMEKKSIISNLGENDPRFVKMKSPANTSSILCVPLISKGEAIGVINITNKKSNKLFNRQDLEFMEALAGQASIAIDNAKLYELATKDGLTKLYIYRHFYTLLENEVKRAKRYGHPLALLMMDIDDFKNVNDTYGHPVGDVLLREIANVITQTVRTIDIPARYGGEEFSVILPETTAEDARIIAERLRKNIQNIKITTKNDNIITPTISIGVSELQPNIKDENMLIEYADIALYNAKRYGKNCIFEYAQTGCFKVNA